MQIRIRLSRRLEEQTQWPQLLACCGVCLVSLTQLLLLFIHLLSNIWLLWWRMGEVIVHCGRESQV